VYRAHDARVFVRRLPRFAPLIAAREISASFAFTLAEGAETIPLRERPAASPVRDCEWQRRLGELLFELEGARSEGARAAYERALAAPVGCLAPADDRRLAAWMGALALGEGHAVAALARLDRALALGDDELATRVNHAVALEQAGRAAEAAVAWDDVAARATDPALAAKARARAAAARR
jgi:hypothetical protein